MNNLKLIIVVIIVLRASFNLFGQNKLSNDQISFETFEAKLSQASSNAQILDARSYEEYKLNHLKGAIVVNVSDDNELQKQLSTLNKRKPVFVYSINNGRSGALAKKLKGLKFNEVYELPGGISKWIGAGKPVESTTGTGLTLHDYQDLLSTDKVVLVDIHSKFCGSCKKLSPIVDSVANENLKTVKLLKIELFENKELGKALNIESLPTLILYKDGKVIWQKSGLISKASIEDVIKNKL